MIEFFLNHHISYALADVLLHSLWQYSVIAFMLWIVLRLTKHLSSNIRYSLCCLALALTVTASTLTSLTVFSKQPSSLQVIQNSVLQSEAASSQVIPSSEEQLSSQLSNLVTTANPTQQIAQQTIERPDFKTFLPWLVIVWIFGIVILSLRLLGSWIFIERLKTQGTALSAPHLQQKLLKISKQLDIRKQVRLFDSSKATVPMVIGYLRPVILLPASTLIGLSTKQLELIIAHELAHIKRHDNLLNVLQHVMICL